MILHSMNIALLKPPIRSLGLHTVYNLRSTDLQLRRHLAHFVAWYIEYLLLVQKIKKEMHSCPNRSNKNLKVIQ